MIRALPALLAGLLLATPGLSACGAGDSRADAGEPATSEHDSGEQEMETAADRSVCRADAEPVARPYDAGFPRSWSFPPQTTVYDVEDRGETGVIVTGVSSAPFADILDYLNHDAVAAGLHRDRGRDRGARRRGRLEVRPAGRAVGDPGVGRLPRRDRDPGLRRAAVVTALSRAVSATTG